MALIRAGCAVGRTSITVVSLAVFYARAITAVTGTITAATRAVSAVTRAVSAVTGTIVRAIVVSRDTRMTAATTVTMPVVDITGAVGIVRVSAGNDRGSEDGGDEEDNLGCGQHAVCICV